jgi:hypothetical protein
MDIFIKTYNKKIWKNIPKPTLDDINGYNLRPNSVRRLNYNVIFSNIAIYGNRFAFSYIFSLLSKYNIVFTFDENLFDHICQFCKKFGIRFILWILRERPNSIIITKSGIKHLIKYGFPSKYIRPIILDHKRYDVYSTVDEYTHKLIKMRENIHKEMVYMAWRVYVNKVLFSNDLSENNYKELSYYHRIVPNDSDVIFVLLWALNGKNVNHVRCIERLIEDNVDVKPYKMYYCYTWYKSSLSFKFIEDKMDTVTEKTKQYETLCAKYDIF